jgi:hypothetical protein
LISIHKYRRYDEGCTSNKLEAEAKVEYEDGSNAGDYDGQRTCKSLNYNISVIQK